MTNTELKVGDLVGWPDGEDEGEEVTRALVVGAKAFDPADGYVTVRWLNGPRRGDTLAVPAKYLALLSDLERVSR